MLVNCSPLRRMNLSVAQSKECDRCFADVVFVLVLLNEFRGFLLVIHVGACIFQAEPYLLGKISALGLGNVD